MVFVFIGLHPLEQRLAVVKYARRGVHAHWPIRNNLWCSPCAIFKISNHHMIRKQRTECLGFVVYSS